MKIKFKKSPIYFLSILFLPLLAFGAFYFLIIKNKGGMALAGSIYLFAFVINLIILIVEQLILIKINTLKKVWIVEIGLILWILLFTFYFTD
ncbi:hypothetical protein [Polaribacter sp. R77954]|uniref:hypothetical protein n=1 Tax=Polaribacter sp. R77954 TaxID=3093870 RepID=UPI0037C5904D